MVTTMDAPNGLPVNRRDPAANPQMILGVNVLGLGQRPAAWQAEHLSPLSFVDREYWVGVGREVERGLFDALFLADAPQLNDPSARPTSALEPTTLLAAVAAETERIGLVATLSTSYNDPVELAARLLTLDHLSAGRAGWNIVTTASPETAANFGAEAGADRDERYRRAAAFTGLVEALWAGAGTGAPVRSDEFGASASLALPRSPQGRPALVQAGASPAGRRIAAQHADAVFTAEMTRAGALENYRLIKDLARAAGRDPHAVKVLPGFALVVGSTEQEAADRYDEWEAKAPDDYTTGRLSGILGIDVGALDLDRPLPEEIGEAPDDPASFGASLSFRATTVRFARENGYTVRQLIRAYGGYGHPIIVGTPARIADTLSDWFLSGGADGFNLMPDVLPDGLTAVVDEVLPILRERGLFRRSWEAPTLRGRWAR
jgi:alkanesulfonate monooxygenase SsuD/methylene tetrahydromethanopterin reductase-like flavin-dependent oxidoreductase (luciferase family)